MSTYDRNQYLKHKEKRLADGKAYRAVRREQYAKYQRKWREENPEESRERERRSRALRLEREAGRSKPDECEVCRSSVGILCFDHCHVSGQFRGWLCSGCNKILGFAGDDPKILEALAAYLRGGNR